MTINVLMEGSVRGHVVVKELRNGKQFASFSMAAADKNGVMVPIRCSTFLNSVLAFVTGLGDGDAICVGGEISICSIPGKDGGADQAGLDIVVNSVQSLQHLAMRRADLREIKRVRLGTDGAHS